MPKLACEMRGLGRARDCYSSPNRAQWQKGAGTSNCCPVYPIPYPWRISQITPRPIWVLGSRGLHDVVGFTTLDRSPASAVIAMVFWELSAQCGVPSLGNRVDNQFPSLGCSGQFVAFHHALEMPLLNSSHASNICGCCSPAVRFRVLFLRNQGSYDSLE